MLQEEKIECVVIIGENLSYDDEVISEGSPHEFIESTFSDLNIFIVHKSEKN